MDYIIGTGYWSGHGFRGNDGRERADFFNIWAINTFQFATPKKLYIIDSNSSQLPLAIEGIGTWIRLDHNFGHIFDMYGDNYLYRFGGWSIGFILGAFLAYSNKCDFIYKEQDCLAFGPWVESLYEDLNKNNLKMLMGKPSYPGFKIEQSLIIIKHEFILEFIKELLNIPENDGGEHHICPENKFYNIMLKHPKEIGYMSMGVGRARPLPMMFPFYAQQITETEIGELKSMQFI